MIKKILFLFFVVFAATAYSQDVTITGTVTDANSEPLVGVNVLVKGTTTGAITDIDGNFSVSGKKGSTLVFSYIGMLTQEVTYKGTALRIMMKDDSKSLEEVVVVGYGVQKKVNLTGSVSSVDISKEAENRPITNLSTGLAGLAPGLFVRSSSNDPGSSASIMLRGQGTLNNSNPLVIVDGVETSMDNVSPHDVASVSVLKDAASSSIYGSRAANGVILITTKQGEEGKVKVSYNGYASFQSVAHLMPLVDNSVEYMELINEGARNSNVAEPYSHENIELWRQNQNGDPLLWPNTNWGEALFRNAFTTNHSLSVSGGTKKLKSYLSFDYSDTPGIIENTGFLRYIIRSNNQYQVNKWLRLGANISGVLTDKERGASNLNSAFTNSVGAVPTVVNRSPDGRYGGTNNVEDNQTVASPLWYFNSIKGDNTTHKFFSDFSVNINPIEGLNINASYHYDIHTNKTTTIPRQNDRWNFQNNTILVSGKTDLYVSKGESRNSKNFMDVNISYERDFFKKLNFRVLLGASQEQFFSESMNVTRRGLISEDLTEIDAASGESSSSGTRTEWAMRSYFGRINLNWDDRYLLELNMRRDGSSRFAKDNRWGNFPSMSVGWRISEENFMESLRESWLNSLKIRASYGSLGNNAIGNYDAVPKLSQLNYVLNSTPQIAFYQGAIANVDVSWESTYVTNIGVDFTMFNNRLNGSIEAYNKLTKDILLGLPAPFVHGSASIPPVNAAQVRNRGVEISLGWQGKVGDFSYYINGNFTHNKNKVVKYKGDEYTLSGASMIKEGLPINVKYILKVDRIVHTQEDLDLIQSMIDNAPVLENGQKANPFPYGRPKMGDLLYKDADRNGIINDDDRQVCGHGPNPEFMYGISLGASYKGFDFSTLIQGIAGLEEYFLNDYYTPNIRWSVIVNKDIADGRWYEGRKSAPTYPRLTMSDSRNTKNSDFWVQDKSYLKIRNIQLGYTIPKHLLSKIDLTNLRFYISLENFFTFTKWKGIDPEVSSVNYPTMKQVVLGVNLSF